MDRARRSVTLRPKKIGRASIRYFALAIGDDNPLYVDDAYARAAGYPSIIAPPTFVCEDLSVRASAARPRRLCRPYLGIADQRMPDDPWRTRLRIFSSCTCRRICINVTWLLEDISEHTIVARRIDAGGDLGRHLCQSTGRYAARSNSRDADLPAGGGSPISLRSPPREQSKPEHPIPPLERTLTQVRMVAYGGATWDWHRLHDEAAYTAARKIAGPIVDGQMFGALLAEALLIGWGRARSFAG